MIGIPSSFWTFRRNLYAISALCLVASHALADLDADQRAALQAVTTHLKSADADLASARGSAGTASNPATGSRLKLTRVRLDQATGRLTAAAEALAKLPADNDQVKTTRKDYDRVKAGVAEVEAILAGSGDAKPAPSQDKPPDEAMTPSAGPAPADVPKLHYQDEDKLKNARSTLREVDGLANAAAVIVARLDGEGEPAVHKDVKDGLATLDTADRKYGFVTDYLAQLPADHPSVQAFATEAAATQARLGALRSRLAAADVELDKLTNMTHYPNYDADYDMMQGFIARYGNFQQSQQQPETLVAIIGEDGKVMAEVQRIAKTYLPLVEQKTEAGAKMENRFSYFMEKRGAFVTEALAYKEQLPGLIDADIAEAMSIAQQGVSEQKPMFFGQDSGIAQQLGFAETKVAVLAAFDAEGAKPSQAKLAETRAQVEEMAESLSQQIIDANVPPPDRFAGDDRDAAIAIAIDGWKVQQPDAEVVKAYIPSEAWERETKWEWWNGSFTKVDRSKLQVQLLVKHNDELVIVRPMNVRKNHLKGDTMIAVPLDDITEKVMPQRYVKVEKLK